jgi:hypothetical protein
VEIMVACTMLALLVAFLGCKTRDDNEFVAKHSRSMVLVTYIARTKVA